MPSTGWPVGYSYWNSSIRHQISRIMQARPPDPLYVIGECRRMINKGGFPACASRLSIIEMVINKRLMPP